MRSEHERQRALAVPAYVQDHGDPAALFTRLQRVVIHLELLQNEAVQDFDITFRDFVILATLFVVSSAPPLIQSASNLISFSGILLLPGGIAGSSS